ncbi:MAG: PspA/IM30 family protein [Woeseiaceae bacterium]|nr:PspA/IM30 family protein [Woeseiaceae bacterium]
MSLIQRISASITSSVDRAVSKVENHDAIVAAALRETQQAAARSRVRLERVRRDGASLKQRREDLELAITRWTERARVVAKNDEAKALECLRRRRECEKQLGSLRTSIEQHDELETRIAEQVKKIDARISEVTQQRNMMRSRQSVAEAMRAINNIEGSTYGDIEDTFDRWEINLGETEILLGASTPSDPLDTAFLAEEDRAELRAELAVLLNDDKEDSS